VLVVGPKSVIPNQAYTLTISNGDERSSSATLKLTLEAYDAQKNVFNYSTNVVVQKYAIINVTMQIPNIPPTASMELTIDRVDGFGYHEEIDLDIQRNLLSGLIQTDKPVYRPGETVRFRVIVLNSDLKSPQNLESIEVRIFDPEGSIIRKLISAKLFSAVFENWFQISSSPILGKWSLSASVDEEVLVSKIFEVKEYVLPSFDVQVVPSVIPLEKHKSLELIIVATYHIGKPVEGTAAVELFLQDDMRDQTQKIQMTGSKQITLNFNDYFEIDDDQQNVRVKVTFTERYTNRIITKDTQVTVYKYPFRVQLVKESPKFRAGRRFKCQLQFKKHDGTPAKGITGIVVVYPLNFEETHTSDNDGLIKLDLHVNDTDEIDIMFLGSDYFYFNETVTKAESGTDAFLKLELRSAINIGSVRPINLFVTCSERMSFFVYYVVSKRKIIESGLIQTKNETKYRMNEIRASEKMMPRAKIFVVTITKCKKVLWDSLDVNFNQLGNYNTYHFHFQLDIRIDEKEVKPGHRISLELYARSGSYVWLAAYNKGLLDMSEQHHDIIWEDVEQLCNKFHAMYFDKEDLISSMGLFVRPSPQTCENVRKTSERSGHNIHPFPTYRTNFMESWLWKNVTIGSSNWLVLHEHLPDTITSWYLTGFSIDPEYGLAIMKKTIKFNTAELTNS
uniref:TEP1-F n=1 Tax=Anopheles dirus TaxID=7168 RepID=A0A182NGI2_9DIPT